MQALLTRYLLHMLLEKKSGVYAVSLTRVLAVIVFVPCLYGWVYHLATTGELLDSLVWSFWMLVGVKGGQSIVGNLKTPTVAKEVGEGNV